MNQEQWDQLLEGLKSKFGSLKIYNEPIVGEERASADVVELTTPKGFFKLVRENRPVIVEKKLHYSHRPGDTARAEYKYSDTNFSHKLRVYKENDDLEFEEVTLENLVI